MKAVHKTWLVLLLSVTCVSIGCKSNYYSDQLATVGGLTGAGLGAVIGDGSNRAAEGALIGGAIGAATGAIVGDGIDEAEARNQYLIQQRMGRQMAGAVTMQDVMSMSSAQLSDEVIRTHIANHGVARPLNANDLIVLKQQGVSDAVINAMQSPPIRQASVAPVSHQPIIVEEHHYAPAYPWPWHGHHRHGHRRPRRHRPHGHTSWGFSFHN